MGPHEPVPREVIADMATAGGLWLRFLSGPDIDSLGLSNAEIVAAVEDAVRAHGDGRVVVEPRVHLVPDNDGAGHFNVLRGHLAGRPGSAASRSSATSWPTTPPGCPASSGC